MGFKELIEKLKLRTGQIITEKWYDDFAEAMNMIDSDLNVGGRLSFSKLPDGPLGKVLIAQGEGKDPVYADPDCNIIKVSGTDLTPRDWSKDFEKLQNIDIPISLLAKDSTLSNILSKLDVQLGTRASESTLSGVLSKLTEMYNKQIDIETKLYEIITKLCNIYERADYLKFGDKSLSVSNRSMYYIENGYGFFASERFENVTANSVITLCLANPSDSTRIAYIDAIKVYSFDRLFANIYVNPNIVNYGVEIPVSNLRLGSTVTNSLKITKNATFEATTPSAKFVIPIYSTMIYNRILIPPNNTIFLELTNVSQVDTSFSITIEWFEVSI